MSRAFLRSELDLEFRAWAASGADEVLLTRLKAWSTRSKRTETQAEGAFTQTFFVETWGYVDDGRADPAAVTLFPKLQVLGAGAGGGMGEADAALGLFGSDPKATPQVLCEFKDIRSALEAPQRRKGNTRSPVRQCQDYIRGARKGLFGNEPVQPWWGLVTDMNEIRLYWWDRMPEQYLRFVIRKPKDDLFDSDLLAETGEASFDRFLFQHLFHSDRLLSQAGKPSLLRLIERQWVKERALEGEFYRHYKAVRERLFNVLTVSNPTFAGSRTDLLRLSQKLLDRFIFAFYCEDMGGRMSFPPQMIRDRLKSRSIEIDYDPFGEELWTYFRRLFGSMDQGGHIGQLRVPHINGGLFAADPEIEALSLPNHVFAAPGQGSNDASLERDTDTLLYLCARYNYASRGDARESLSLYTLGRIFEQSITELEYRQGELEDRDTVVALSERKRNGVYYTPEWAVNLLVKSAIDPWFAAARQAASLPTEDDDVQPTLEGLVAYEARLKAIRVVDPACGSGAFLISAFRRLLDERMGLARQIAGLHAGPDGIAEVVVEAAVIGEILESNIYGVDLNPASVEIAKLALWLHSARADAPLSSLDHTLRCGNSLVGPDFWQGRTDDPDLRERVSAFDWATAFPEVRLGHADGGFDIVLGNPPYVKRQHLEATAPEVAAYPMAARGDDTYRSARTANFDLYLPFFEKGLRLLGPGGRMGFIAPSLWPINQYGEGLRGLVRAGRNLERWVDFKSYQ
ncbi:DNA methyltransferase, partial [Phenylobacterium sp.]|uniref:Eco57I restriction-modification methylase domain-containing protein n=1 Tax=Phenylobacterium sp. TaxID=1871053 RepID=UPI0025CC5BF0